MSALMNAAGQTRYPERNRLLVALTFFAGMRMPEIARLNRHDVEEKNGHIRDALALHEGICKRTPGRVVPIAGNKRLRQALLDHLLQAPGQPEEPLIGSERGGRMRADALAYIFYKLYRQADLRGYTAFSGRRTHITRALEEGGGRGESLEEIFQKAGLKALGTMEPYAMARPDRKQRDTRQLTLF